MARDGRETKNDGRGRTYALRWLSPKLHGLLLWGRPDGAQVQELMRALDATFAEAASPCSSLVDMRLVEGIDLHAFKLLSDYVHSNRQRLAKSIQMQALLCADGIVGATVTGFYAQLVPRHPVRIFMDVSRALAWVGVEDRTRVVDALDEIRTLVTDFPPIVPALRSYLERALGEATLPGAASALRMAPRTLQRRLSDAGTSYQRESQQIQVLVAKRLLSETSHDLKRIAIEVGCASPQNFSALFRKLEGTSPSQWRASRSRASAVASDAADNLDSDALTIPRSLAAATNL